MAMAMDGFLLFVDLIARSIFVLRKGNGNGWFPFVFVDLIARSSFIRWMEQYGRFRGGKCENQTKKNRKE